MTSLTIVSLIEKLYPHFSVLVGSRNRFECDNNAQWLPSQSN